MLVEVIIFPDGKRTHEVIERAQGENCQIVHQIDAGSITGEEQTGPDCDTVHETES
jgi:hypothetical protein